MLDHILKHVSFLLRLGTSSPFPPGNKHHLERIIILRHMLYKTCRSITLDRQGKLFWCIFQLNCKANAANLKWNSVFIHSIRRESVAKAVFPMGKYPPIPWPILNSITLKCTPIRIPTAQHSSTSWECGFSFTTSVQPAWYSLWSLQGFDQMLR